MTDEQEQREYPESTNFLKTLANAVYIHRLPSYANKIFYGLGFLTLTSLLMLIITGTVLAFMGQDWWLHAPLGIYVRSVHLWSVQAFIAFMILHFIVGFSTSGFKPPRRIIWVIGATIFCLALIQTEFGYGLRGDFSSQFRAVSGADFWNGAYLGWWVNPLSYMQEFAIHVAIIPIAIIVLFVLHFIFIRSYGIAKPYRKDIKYKMVDADHRIMYIRGIVLVVLLLALALVYHSPYVPAATIAGVAQKQPRLVERTLLQELDHTSDTATYVDSIDPYTFDTAHVFVGVPYDQLMTGRDAPNQLLAFQQLPVPAQKAALKEAYSYVKATSTAAYASSTNPLIGVLGTLMPAVHSGLYQTIVAGEKPSINDTYVLRFLNDMSVPEDVASTMNMDTEQWGMVKDETNGTLQPPGSWWLMPLAISNSLFDLPDQDTGDRTGAEILGFLMLVFIAFPYIPYLNRVPEYLHIAPIIWKEPADDGREEVKDTTA